MHAMTVAHTSALCHCSVSSHSPVKSYCSSSLVNLAFVSLLSPSNLGSHSLPLGSGPWLTLTDTDHSYSSSRWQGTSASKFFCHSRFCCNYFLSLLPIPFSWVWKVFKRSVRVLRGSCCSQVSPGMFLVAAAIECLQSTPWEMCVCKRELSLESL